MVTCLMKSYAFSRFALSVRFSAFNSSFFRFRPLSHIADPASFQSMPLPACTHEIWNNSIPGLHHRHSSYIDNSPYIRPPFYTLNSVTFLVFITCTNFVYLCYHYIFSLSILRNNIFTIFVHTIFANYSFMSFVFVL